MPSALDANKACFIAPDHLLLGHARDCVNFALKVLQTRKARQDFEEILIELMIMFPLPAQTRLVNQEKKALFGMSMTEMYALIFVAPHAFKKHLTLTDFAEVSPAAQKKCSEAINLVNSFPD